MQSPATQPHSAPHIIASSVAAFRLTAREMIDSACQPGGPALPKLATLAAAPAGSPGAAGDGCFDSGQQLQVNALDFQRCCTFRVVCSVALGLPLDCLDLPATLDIVHRVTNYFKVKSWRVCRPSLSLSQHLCAGRQALGGVMPWPTCSL